MKPSKNKFTTLKVSRENINRLFKLKTKQGETFNDVIGWLLDLIDNSQLEKVEK